MTGAVGGVGHGVGAGPAIVKSIRWPDEAATQSFAQALAAQPALRNAFIELHGGLGAGKTSFVRHLLRAMGVQGRIKSPTYAVVEPYEIAGLGDLGDLGDVDHVDDIMPPLAIWHFDFYRFNDPREWEDAGFRDIFASPGLKLAEWPENAASHLPRADLVMRIEVMADESRQVLMTAQTRLGAALLAGTAQ